MDRTTLLITALSAGVLYAALRVLVVILYPPLASYLWQYLIGPSIVRLWPTAAQADDQGRLSYMPETLGQPFVIKLSLGSVGDVSQGIRDGLLLGVFVALVPEFSALLLTVLAAVPLVRGAWKISQVHGAARTDAAFHALRDCLLYVAVVQAISVAGLLRTHQ